MPPTEHKYIIVFCNKTAMNREGKCREMSLMKSLKVKNIHMYPSKIRESDSM